MTIKRTVNLGRTNPRRLMILLSLKSKAHTLTGCRTTKSSSHSTRISPSFNRARSTTLSYSRNWRSKPKHSNLLRLAPPGTRLEHGKTAKKSHYIIDREDKKLKMDVI